MSVPQAVAMLDQTTADRLSAGFHRCFSEFVVEPDLFAALRTVPTADGFVTEHVETQHTPTGSVVARRLHLCEVRAGRICAVTTYCNGGWDEELRVRHAAEAPMIRP